MTRLLGRAHRGCTEPKAKQKSRVPAAAKEMAGKTCPEGPDTSVVTGSNTQRVQGPNILGLCSQLPLRVWLLEPETSYIRYLDLWDRKQVPKFHNRYEPWSRCLIKSLEALQQRPPCNPHIVPPIRSFYPGSCGL